MTKLNYANAAALIADFNAGAKFAAYMDGREYHTPITGFTEVSTNRVRALHGLGDGGIGVFPIDGSRMPGYSRDWRLVKTADAPKAAEPSLIYPLPFKTFDEMVDAFEAGTEFVLNRPTMDERFEVMSLTRTSYGVAVAAKGQKGLWTEFTVDGYHVVGISQLSVRGEIKRPQPKTEAPLLKRFVLGEDFHCPKTGENLFSVVFVKGELRVYLKEEATGKLRFSTNYKHDGVHKFHADRSLVKGKYVKPVPPAPKTVKATIYKHAYNGGLFVIRDGEVLPNIRGISNATVVGTTEIAE